MVQCSRGGAELTLSVLFSAVLATPGCTLVMSSLIILSYCQTLLCSFIHFKVTRKERERGRGRRKEETGEGGVEEADSFWYMH